MAMDPAGLPQPTGPTSQALVPLTSPPEGQSPAGTSVDPVLQNMLLMAPPAPVKKEKVPRLPQPSRDDCVSYANSDKSYYSVRNQRMARDTEIFRQWQSGVPSTFDETEDIRWIGAAMSNLVNRLANMMGGLEEYVEASYKDDKGEQSSQKVEDLLYNCIDWERRIYAQRGGNPVQRDKFFYLFLRGWLCGRILPDLSDDDYPFDSVILDPATCYPVWGNEKQGLMRMTRIYTATTAELLSTYGQYNKGLKGDIVDKLTNDRSSVNDYLNKEWELVEYWDRDWRYVGTRDGLDVLPVKAHGLNRVPFAMVSAVGEPFGFQTPDANQGYMDPVYGPMPTGNSNSLDLAQKGVSVMHYLINTHRLGEALRTLLYAEVEKASNPPTMRYRAPQLLGQDIPDADYKIGGQNEAAMGLEKVEGLPTSPHPTDTSPLLQSADRDFVEGSMSPPGQGMDVGPNASGYSLDTLIASAKEMVLPYLQAYENFETLKFEIKLSYLREIILPLMPMQAPVTSQYGKSGGVHDITLDDLDAIGTYVRVKIKNINEQNKPAIIQSAVQQMQAGIISQRAAMEQTGIRNPNKMFAEILSEKALQHPMVEQLFSIPSALQAMGADDLAQFWATAVAGPAIQQQGMMGGGQPGEPPSPGGPSTPPNQGGTPNPTPEGTPPTGPLPGQGRGPG
jgi:hypothetical protein